MNGMARTTSNVTTHTCTLKFSDGSFVSALINTVNDVALCPVLYAGAVERLPFQFEFADPLLLRVLFRSFARELKACYQQGEIGRNQPTFEDLEDEVLSCGINRLAIFPSQD